MDYLDSRERAQLEGLRQTDPFVAETLRECEHILASGYFARVHQEMRDFLGFVVGKKLLGRESEIKEVTVAVHVFHETADYDSAESARIRVAAASLRERLSRYYADEGKGDPMQIIVPIGTYVPQILDRRISIAVSLFENWNPKGDQDHLCATVSDEIAHRLNQMVAVEAKRVPALKATGRGPRYGLRGSVECQGDSVRLNISLSNFHAGTIILRETLEGRRDDIIRLSAGVATAILATLRSGGGPKPTIHKTQIR